MICVELAKCTTICDSDAAQGTSYGVSGDHARSTRMIDDVDHARSTLSIAEG
jgi:hypothetical protein